MVRNRAVLQSLTFARPARFDLIESPQDYSNELIYFTTLYAQNSRLGEAVAKVRALVKQLPDFHNTPDDEINIKQAEEALHREQGESKSQLESAIRQVQAFDVPAMESRYRAAHYQIFMDYPTEFTALLPKLINGFFDAFSANFVVNQ